jgi:hypothetical protein
MSAPRRATSRSLIALASMLLGTCVVSAAGAADQQGAPAGEPVTFYAAAVRDADSAKQPLRPIRLALHVGLPHPATGRPPGEPTKIWFRFNRGIS